MALDFGYWSALTGPMQTAGQRAQNRDAQNMQAMQLMQQMKQIQLGNLQNTKALQEQVNTIDAAAMSALYTKDKKFRRQKDVDDFKNWQKDLSGWNDIQNLLRQYGSVENARLHGNLDYVIQEYKHNLENNPISQRVKQNEAAVKNYYAGALDEGEQKKGGTSPFELIPKNAHIRFQNYFDGKTDNFSYHGERGDYLNHPDIIAMSKSKNITLDDIVSTNLPRILTDMTLDAGITDPVKAEEYKNSLSFQDIKTWVHDNTGHSESGGLEYFTTGGYKQPLYGTTESDTYFATDLSNALDGVNVITPHGKIDDLLEIKKAGSSFNKEFKNSVAKDFEMLGGVDYNSDSTGPDDRGLFGQSWFTKDRQIITSPRIFSNPGTFNKITEAAFGADNYNPEDKTIHGVKMDYRMYNDVGHLITDDDTTDILGYPGKERNIMWGDMEARYMDLTIKGYHVAPKVVGKDANGNPTSMLIVDTENEAEMKKIRDNWSEYDIQYTIVAELEDSDRRSYRDQFYREIDLKGDSQVSIAINSKFDREEYNQVKQENIDLDKRQKLEAKRIKTQDVLKAKIASQLNLPNNAAVDETVDAYSKSLSVGLINAGVSNVKANAVMPMLISDLYIESRKPREYPFVMEKDNKGNPTLIAKTSFEYMAHQSQKLKQGLNTGQMPEMLEAINSGPSAYDIWRKTRLDKKTYGKTSYLSREMGKYYHGRE